MPDQSASHPPRLVTKADVKRQSDAPRPTPGRAVSSVSSDASDAIEQSDDGRVVVPLAEERVELGKRTVETGKVRIIKTVKQEEQVYDQAMFREDVEVQRVPKEEFVKKAAGPRHEGETLVIPLYEEVLVVEKRLMLREEIRVTRRRTERVEPQSVTVRKEEAHIEREGSADRPAGPAEGKAKVNIHG